MTDLVAARSQMAMSLAFHIIFAAVGMAMPLMMAMAEWRWLRTGQNVYLTLAQRWAKGTAILFAVGAVSGTVLSFELGLLWPAFMQWAGPMIGLLFSLEGFAFFTEAIFLGIYLHGWDRVSPIAHFVAGLVVAASGVASGIFVVIANGWMNTPRGFRIIGGRAADIEPWAVVTNPSGMGESVHMILAAFIATGFVVAGIHAFLLLRDRGNLFHQRALNIAFLVGAIPALLQPLSGDILAKTLARHQPAKLAAFEAHFHTAAKAPFIIGGIPDMDNETVPYSLQIPHALSLLLYHDSNAVVTGLDDIPRDQWPPVGIVHTAFQIMVGIGLVLAVVALWGGWLWWKHRCLWVSERFLRTLVVTAPLGFLAIETGWVVTEVGRQPWIIAGVMRTTEGVTPMPGLIVPLVFFTLLYLFLAGVVLWLLLHHIAASPDIRRATRA